MPKWNWSQLASGRRGSGATGDVRFSSSRYSLCRLEESGDGDEDEPWHGNPGCAQPRGCRGAELGVSEWVRVLPQGKLWQGAMTEMVKGLTNCDFCPLESSLKREHKGLCCLFLVASGSAEM